MRCWDGKRRNGRKHLSIAQKILFSSLHKAWRYATVCSVILSKVINNKRGEGGYEIQRNFVMRNLTNSFCFSEPQNEIFRNEKLFFFSNFNGFFVLYCHCLLALVELHLKLSNYFKLVQTTTNSNGIFFLRFKEHRGKAKKKGKKCIKNCTNTKLFFFFFLLR